MPVLRRWLPHRRASESDGPNQRKDEEQSLFCESLLTLMQRSGRFDYLDYSKDKTEQEKEKEKEKEKETIEITPKEKEGKGKEGKERYLRRSLKRFSWSR